MENDRKYSKIYQGLDCKVREIIFEQKEKVEEILNNKKSLFVADKLLEKETLLIFN